MLISVLIQHDPVSGFQMYLDGTHLLGYILACALYQPLAQIGGELCLRIGGDVDAAAERSAHVGGYLTDCVHFHRVRDEDSFLSVCVVNGKLNRNDRPLMFQRSDCYAETFTLNPCRSDKDGIAWDDFSATAIGSRSRSRTACPSVTLCAP